MPGGCTLVGVQLTDDVDLPSFRHPERAAYVVDPKRRLSPAMLKRCEFVVKIPTSSVSTLQPLARF